MTTKQDIRNEGFRRGQSIASWVDLPEIGTRLRPQDDWVGYNVVTEANQFGVWEMLCGERDCPMPDEYDESNKPYDVYEVFRAGVEAGIQAYGRKHHKAAIAAAKEG